MKKEINELLKWQPLINTLKDKIPLSTNNGYGVQGVDDVGYCYGDKNVSVYFTLQGRLYSQPLWAQLFISLELLTRLSKVDVEYLEICHSYKSVYKLIEKHIGVQTLNNL